MDYEKISNETRNLRNKYNNAELLAIIDDLQWFISKDLENKNKKENIILAIVCPECHGTGQWECDEMGNEYSHPLQCDDCGGSGARIKLPNGSFQEKKKSY